MNLRKMKWLGLLTIMTLLAALLPPMASADTGGPTAAAPLVNGGFEQTAGGKPVGWIGYGSSIYGSVYAPVRSGGFSVKLTDNSPQAGNGVRSGNLPVEPGKPYKASAYGYNESGSSQLYLEFWNAAGERIDVKIAGISGTQQWRGGEVIAEAPAGAAYATLLLYQPVGNVGVAYFDDAMFAEVSRDMPYNGGFEEVSAGKPVGWTPLGSGFEYGAVTNTVYSGVYSLKLVDPNNTAAPGLRSGSMPVVPDQLYEASVQSYNESGVSQLYLEFWNSSNVRIDTKIATNSTTGTWSPLKIEGYAPQGAAYATLLVYLHKANIGTAYFDAASFRLLPPEPVREFPLLTAGHPRLYFTSADLPAMQARAADTTNAPFGRTGKQLWDSVKSAADAYLTETSFSRTYYAGKVVTFPLPPVQPGPIENPPGFTSPYPYWTMMTRSIQDRLETLSLAYAVSGNTAYADKAKQYVLSLAGWNAWTDPTYPCGGYTCLDTAHLTFGVSMAFDVLYDRLTAEERTLVMNALETKGLIPLYKDARSKIDHNIQSLRAAALGTGASVLLGHSPNANAYLTRAMDYYRWYLDERMTSGKQEGMQYTSYAMDNMIKAFDHIDRVTGVRELADHPFLNDFLVRWIVYALAPGGAGLANFSDSGTANYFGLTMTVINAWLNNGQAGWYLKETGGAAGGTDGFLYFRPNAAIASPEEWPASAVLDENGWATLRSGWGSDDVLFAMVANNSTLGHNHYDQNSFQIATNRSWIATDPGYQDYVAGPVNQFTVRFGHSTIQVDGKGQSVLGGGSMTEGLLAPTYDYVKGSAAGAYTNPKLTRFDRHVVYLKPDTFVMLDDLRSDAPHTYDWVLYSGDLAEFEIDGEPATAGETKAGNSLYLRKGGAELAAAFLDDTQLPITVTKYAGAESYGYYSKVGSGGAASDHRFLTVMKARPYEAPGAFDESNLLPLTDSSGREVKLVQANGSTVIFYRGEAVGDYMTVTVDVPETGDYSLTSRFLKSPLYGTVQAYVDGQPVGGVYDGYAAAVEGPVAFPQGNVSLTAGTHTIRYEIVGKNASSGNYFIGLDAIQLLPEGSGDPSKLTVQAELVQGTNGIGALVDRDDDSGVRDLVAFRTGSGSFAVGDATGDAEQAVVSRTEEGGFAGFKMTRGTALGSGGSVLLAGAAPFSASFDTDSVTKETYGIVETDSAQNVRIHAPEGAMVIVDGALLGPSGYTVQAAAGTIEIALTAGRHDVRIVPLADEVAGLIERWSLQPPVAPAALNAARQAEHHWNKGSAAKAAEHLQRLLDHVNDPSLRKFIAEPARAQINEAVERVKRLMQL
ncbi:FIMAH domain-containing protein [Paenibacillus sp. GYB003]|uniref:FIMAH domain-containing protein n=1 Tax=Paenibacillus sp. GYB003 TaxID=2994392 RepID=UPI002F967403